MDSVSISLTNRVALITGAGSGIGAAMAHLFAKAGATVIVTDRNAPAAKLVVDRCHEFGGKAWMWEVDVCSSSSVAALFGELQRRENRLDILVNNAARTDQETAKSFADHTEADWESFVNVILFATARCCSNALPLLRESRGVILNISSVHATSPRNAAAYGAAKAAVENLTRKVASELAADGIRANVLAPGWIDTPGVCWSTKDMAATQRAVQQHIPLGRLGRPEEIAQVALFLVSDLSSYMTGAVVLADGGWMLR